MRAARRRSGVTQEEAAQAAGVSRATISNWEAGRNMPCLVQYRSLCTLYGVTGYQILFGENLFELTRSEALELAKAARGFSPQLCSKIDVLMTLLSKAGADGTITKS